ncbi:MAG: TonB-dependent receptor, partial [Hymenobacteraceae bacterium]|nr:TonB-dependent receptor [Hymenobacteraceae bacterium]MDX5396927.1 TonB-dependent receptor [Hymenobacteraceae bacterium]MDX5513001.1 TonB-dependent receptor [Hymenobacteraceae bacterium]
RGSSNVRVLINNKPSTIMAASVADALRQIPADMIKTIEVITSPSAKYDAEGTAGIINIITKKNTLQGVNGNVNSSLGTRYSNLFLSTNMRRNNFGINANVGGNFFNNKGYSRYTRTDYVSADAQNLTYQQSDYHNFNVFNYGQIGFDYDINKKNTINGSVRMHLGNMKNDNQLASQTSFNNQWRSFVRDIDTRNRNRSVDVNLDYTHYFEKPQQEITTLALYSRSRRTSHYDLQQHFQEPVLPDYLENSDNVNINEEITLQSDYVHPLANKTQIETGVKAILRNVSSDYSVSNFDFNTEQYRLIEARSNEFNYQQNVGSTYASYGFKVKEKYTVKAGGRYEFTTIDGDFVSSGTTISDQYHNFIPSVMVMRDLSQTQKLRLSYSRRIQRPMIFYLNPFVNTSDSLNISFGNPYLDPEVTNSYELNYSTFFKNGNSVNASAYMRQTNNAIESIRSVYGNGVSYTTYQNIASNATYGFSLYGSLKVIPKWWTINGNANVYYTKLNSVALNTENASWLYNLNATSSWTLWKGFSAQMFAMYNSPRIQLQGTSSAWRYYNMAIKKEFLDKKASLSLGLDYFLNKTLDFTTESKGENFELKSNSYNYARGVRLSFSYQFGKMDFKQQQRRRRSIKNDDVKQGESGNSGGMN